MPINVMMQWLYINTNKQQSMNILNVHTADILRVRHAQVSRERGHICRTLSRAPNNSVVSTITANCNGVIFRE